MGFASLERVYAHSKHAKEFFGSKQVDRDLTFTVWLRNEGPKCARVIVSYVELAEMLTMLGRVAMIWSTQNMHRVSSHISKPGTRHSAAQPAHAAALY